MRADQGQVEQVIINLAVNARDAMTEGGELTIETGNETFITSQRRAGETVPPGDYVVVRVADTGVGIPKENLEHIFEPFFTTKEPGKGTGLGLALVYNIIEELGGEIRIESPVADTGRGTCVNITLPRFIS